MVLSLVVNLGMTLFHTQTMKELIIDDEIKQSFDENSQEYKNICQEYAEQIGFEREEDKDKFDEGIMKILVSQAKEEQLKTIEQIEEVIRNCYYQDTSAYVSFGGYLINPKHFCAIRVDGFDIKVNKR